MYCLGSADSPVLRRGTHAPLRVYYGPNLGPREALPMRYNAISCQGHVLLGFQSRLGLGSSQHDKVAQSTLLALYCPLSHGGIIPSDLYFTWQESECRYQKVKPPRLHAASLELLPSLAAPLRRKKVTGDGPRKGLRRRPACVPSTQGLREREA
ncbi:hypothetical protein LX36DRAFT_157835 [Colletotrichum falcatum]|nr:hypothetical protein LX36DRAFT_157835 [Colletotrichum falcatum]